MVWQIPQKDHISALALSSAWPQEDMWLKPAPLAWWLGVIYERLGVCMQSTVGWEPSRGPSLWFIWRNEGIKKTSQPWWSGPQDIHRNEASKQPAYSYQTRPSTFLCLAFDINTDRFGHKSPLKVLRKSVSRGRRNYTEMYCFLLL